MITDETETGKTSLARYIHAIGPRSQRPFMSINCASIPEALVEAELFGYVEGVLLPRYQATSWSMEVSDARRLKALEDENRRLRKLLAESMLDNAALKDILGKNG